MAAAGAHNSQAIAYRPVVPLHVCFQALSKEDGG